MPAKEIKELRQSGKLEEALIMAKAELESDSYNIWPKRNISWVYYDYLKLYSSSEHFDSYISTLNAIKALELSVDEKMFFDNLSWQIGKFAFILLKVSPIQPQQAVRLFELIKDFHFEKPSEGYSFLLKAFHKSFKETNHYLEFADWWDFENLMPKDFEKEKLENGREIMSIAEQAYITYAKHLLPKQDIFGHITFDRNKASAFLPILTDIVENYPEFQYPAYFNAKLILALGDQDNLLESLLPFAKRKRNDFWVWQIFAEAFPNDPDKIFACYCKALSCKSPEEMLVGLRQKMAALLVARQFYDEAKTEIDLLVNARLAHDYKIPNEVISWKATDWYKNASASASNIGFYKTYISIAESLLFSDVKEELVFVEFVNTTKKIANFISSETKFGFFKYDRFLKELKIGDVLKVRFNGGANEGMFQLYTAVKVTDLVFQERFVKEISGTVRITSGNSFGFVEDIYIHPAIISKLNLTNGMSYSGSAIKAYNKEKKQWSWKVIA